MLSNTQSVNFIGYIEGNQLLQDAADVVVAMALCGAARLKNAKAMAQLFIDKLKRAWWLQ